MFSCSKTVRNDEWITSDDDKNAVDIYELTEKAPYKAEIPEKIKKNVIEEKSVKKSYHKLYKASDKRNLLLVLPLTGKLSIIGNKIKRAIEKTNSELESPYNILYFDTESNMYERKGDLYNYLVSRDMKFIIGGLGQEDTKDIAEVALIKNLIVFSFSPASDLALIYKNLIIQSLTPENIVYSIVKYSVFKKKFKKFAILYPYTEAGLKYYEYFKYYADYFGAEVTTEVMFNPKAPNLDKPISKLVKRDNPYLRPDFQKYIRHAKMIANPYKRKHYLEVAKMKLKPVFDYDAVFLPVSYKKINFIIPLLAAWDLPLKTNNKRLMEQVYHKYLDKNQKYVQVLGIPFWYNSDIFNDPSPYINGAIFPSPFSIDLSDKSNPFVNLFKEDIVKKKSIIYEALSYDLINIIYYVFENRQSIEEYEGVMGTYEFRKNQLFKNFSMAIIHNNRIFTVYDSY